VISLSHVLEHVPDPRAFLRALLAHIAPGGCFLIAVPDLRQNPIDLVIADHCTHFDANSFGRMLHNAGLAIDMLASDGLPKELVAIARVGSGTSPPSRRSFGNTPLELFERYLALLSAVSDAAREAHDGASDFGIMGSSIAAVWLAGELGSGVNFFVDEDKGRIGGQLLGQPIFGMDNVPPGATVFIPLSVPVAQAIIARARAYPIRFVYADGNRPVGQNPTFPDGTRTIR
jgi:hypothetical protein